MIMIFGDEKLCTRLLKYTKCIHAEFIEAPDFLTNISHTHFNCLPNYALIHKMKSILIKNEKFEKFDILKYISIGNTKPSDLIKLKIRLLN